MNGTVKRKNTRGFGFITTETGEEVFFHTSELVGVQFDDLQEGDAVTFEMGMSDKGPKATGVSRAA